MDLWAQARFLGEHLLGDCGDNFYQFQYRYAVMKKRTMGSHTFNQVVGYRNLEKLSELIGRFSSRILKEECLDLPEKVEKASRTSAIGDSTHDTEIRGCSGRACRSDSTARASAGVTHRTSARPTSRALEDIAKLPPRSRSWPYWETAASSAVGRGAAASSLRNSSLGAAGIGRQPAS